MPEVALGTTLTKEMSGSEIADLIIHGLTKLGEIGVEREEIDTTNHESPDGYKESEPGLKDAGEVPYEGIILNDEDVNTMLALLESGSKESWYTTSPSGAKWAFTAWVKAFKESEAPVDDVRRYTFTLRISGKPVFTEAGASA